MRSDETLSQNHFRRSPQWKLDPLTGEIDDLMATRYSRGKETVDGQLRWHSFSGHERNCLFLNQAGTRFKDVSAISGVDNVADGRAFAVWDYDHDGWFDLALTNANRPLLNLYRNRMREVDSFNGRFIAIRFVGGNQQSHSTDQYSARDAYGVRVRIAAGELKLMRELRCGEGFAAQNSDTMLVGLGQSDTIDNLVVNWPSGKSTSIEKLAANQLLIAYEEAVDGQLFEKRAYRATTTPAAATVDRFETEIMALLSDVDRAQLHLIVTTATWCEACKRQLPQIARLREAFSTEQLTIWAVPADPIETREDFKSYLDKYQPHYQLLANIDNTTRQRVLALIRSETKSDALPSSILVDRDGLRLHVQAGVPSVSELAKAAETHLLPAD